MQGVSLEINSSETVVLLGPSGCGKTTLLKLINRIIELDAGSIHIGNQPSHAFSKHELRRNIGYVIQDVGLLPHLTVVQNISLVNRIYNESLSPEKLNELLELIGLPKESLKRFPSELSGGQQQRVGIARALANDPDIILMDEPFSALDNITRNQLQDDFLSIPILAEKTIILVTHDVQEAFKLADRIALLNEGEVQQFGTPGELLAQPSNQFVSTFLAKDRLMLYLQNQDISGKKLTDFLQDDSIDPGERKFKLAQVLSDYQP